MFFPSSTNIRYKLRLFGFLTLLALVVGEAVALSHVRSRLGDVALRADSLEVSLDQTRAVLVGVDVNRNFWQRRAYQSNMRADVLDKQLGQESRVRDKLSFTVDSLNTALSSVSGVRDSSGNRVARFHTYKAPYTVDVGVSLPAPPDTGVAQVKVTTDTAHVGVRVGCGKSVAGVKPASVTVSTPTWLKVNIDSAEQDAGVCNEKKPSGMQIFLARTKDVLKFSAGVLIGHLLF